MKKAYFRVSRNNNTCVGTSLQGYVTASYKRLRELLGPPLRSGDGYKVSTEWIVSRDGGKTVVTIYDYKATRLYDRNNPSVKEFRALPEYDWHIGAKDEATAEAFIEWVNGVL